MKKLFEITVILIVAVINTVLPQTPQDNPYYSTQYYLHPIGVPEFWQYAGYGNSNIVVAVLGMGVSINHPDLNENIFINNYEIPGNGIDDDGNGYIDDYKGWNTINGSSNVLPDEDNATYMHETYISGILAAELNYEGIVGVAPYCKILPVKCYHPTSNPDLTQQIADAFDYVLDLQQQFSNKRFLINFSYGFGPTELDQNYITPIINNCVAEGIIVFCGAGNAYGEPVKYPANLSSTLSITELWPGINNQFNVVGQSNHGPENDLAAPGTMLHSTGYNNGYQPFNGTSASTPVAAGIAALFLSVDMSLTPQDVKELLIDGTDKVGGVNYNWNPQMPGHSLELGYGRVNAIHNLLVFKNDVEGISMGSIKVNGEIKPSGHKNLYLDDEQITVEITSTVYNNGTYDTKFYEWSYFDNSNYRRTPQNTFLKIREIAEINSRYKQTKPLTVRNALEGTLDGGMILFGESTLPGDVVNRNSPYTENAFIYQQGIVNAQYLAEASPTHNLYNTSWNFINWENGSTNPIREAQISQSSPPEWRAIYKGQLMSNDQNAISSASQRKIVRTDNGRYHVVYESLGHVFYAHSATYNFLGEWYADQIVLFNARNPAIAYNGNTVLIVCEEYHPQYGGYAKLQLLTFQQSLQGGWYENTDVYEITTYPVSYYGSAKPVISYTPGEIFIAYRKAPTGDLKQTTALHNYQGQTWGWLDEADITGTGSDAVNPAVVGEPYFIHIAYENLGTIRYRRGYLRGVAWEYSNIQYLSSGSGFNNNRYPAVSLSNSPNKYVMVSWQGIYDGQHEGPMPKETEGLELLFRKAAVVRTGWGLSWGTISNFSDNVDFTNNGSINMSYGSIMAWSESEGQYSKYVRRRHPLGYDPITALSTNGIHILVSNGSEFGSIKAMAFNTSGSTPYRFNRCTDDFTYIPDGLGKITETGVIDISYGRSGIIEKNGIEFVFNIGDVLLNGETIKFIERADTISIGSIEELNAAVRTDTLILNSQSELIFSDYYYVVNGERADSLLSNEFNVNFKCELVKLSTGEVIGLFEHVNYNKTNLDEYGHEGYLVDCSGIDAGDYYLRLTAEVNEEVGLSLSDIQMDNVLLEKSQLNIRNFKGDRIPIDYALEQNYPNPFNPTTTIRYQLPKDGLVTLKVYDILGAEVATLVNEEKVAGKYEVNFNASSFASGVYIYRLQVNDYISVKKMVLLK